MISVKKQGPFEVFSRGVEEPWVIWRDGSFFKQAWTWDEVEKILAGETKPVTEALGTVKLGSTTHHVISENPNGLTIRGPKGGVSHLVPTTNQPGVYAHNKIGKLAAAYYRRAPDGTFTKIR
jgi:hypothetical protein